MPHYPPRPPPGIRRWFWATRIKVESSFGLAMLDDWEKGLIYAICLGITFIFWASVLTYYPSHLNYLSRRFSYYIFDDETVDVGLMAREWTRQQIMSAWRKAGGIIGVGGSSGKTKIEL